MIGDDAVGIDHVVGDTTILTASGEGPMHGFDDVAPHAEIVQDRLGFKTRRHRRACPALEIARLSVQLACRLSVPFLPPTNGPPGFATHCLRPTPTHMQGYLRGR
jgi:hypothetical protein